MLEKTYKSMNSRITPAPSLITATAELVQHSRKHDSRKSRPFYRRPLAVAAMLALCFVLATPVLAANVPVIYELMYLVSPQVAQFFVPVQESCEDNGIRMEVVSAYIHGNTAEIYVTLQDLTGDRVDETTDLFDSYSIRRAFDSAATCHLVGYDKETKTASFLILLTEWGSQDITGSKLTFSVREFISRKTSLEAVESNINLAEVDEAATTQAVYAVGRGGINLSQYTNDSNNYAVLVPGASIYTPIRGLDVTAIGYIDGMLHIQLATSEKLTLDNHGYFYLVDKAGMSVPYDYSVSFVEGMDSSGRVDYQEFVFDIPQDEIGDYTLFGSFVTSGLNTKGRWQVTFPLT